MSVIANRVKVAVDGTPGTGTINLGAAVTGFQSFADGGITNGQVVSYAIEDGDAWEIGTGTYTTGTPNTLSRTVIESSNSDAALDLSSNAVVFITALSGELQNAVDMDQGVATTDSPSFADLTLSGGVYLGGTGSANLLDDYEEGTFTPVIADAASGGNEGSAANVFGYYTKIGRQVTVQITFINIDTTGLTGANDLYITGLPFSAGSLAGANTFTGAMSAALITSTADVVVPEILDSVSYVRLREGFLSGSGSDWLLVSELTSGTADLNITLTYFSE